MHHHGEQGAELDDDLEGLLTLAGQTEEAPDEDQVSGGRDRQVLRDALGNSEDDGVDQAQELPRAARAARRHEQTAGEDRHDHHRVLPHRIHERSVHGLSGSLPRAAAGW